MSENLMSINIQIADRHYRIRVKPDDEQAVRKTISIINDKIIAFKNNFPGKDMQDYISMVLLWYATESNTKTVSLADEKDILEKLNQIEKLLVS
ncbi:MAG TPA: cell division protein ZapA [Niabella sp.]|jgi:cell division protein ZapA (FtsZ GTPase activity inhibitor)|nr:cell division protein ZapA [Chitinophagaceae bacterium]HRN48963.1 cell division protein ZapA [Niabella sp.]HRO84748.1 cell division protein ZapA [Niabella sp.]HUN03668.1 cell division protein ZapA [Niabella sp.]